jgi:hypothetical protein
MREITRRDAIRAAGGLAAVGLVAYPVAAQGNIAKDLPPLDGVLRVTVTPQGAIELRFDTPATASQTFDSSEYRYAVLDSAGTQVTSPQLEVSGALVPTGAAYHPVLLPKDTRSVADYSEVMLDHSGLKAGGEYYLVVSVRNLTALTKFKSPRPVDAGRSA